MLKTKIFTAASAASMQKEINEWLELNCWVKIMNITQSSGMDKICISIWYEEPDVPLLQRS